MAETVSGLFSIGCLQILDSAALIGGLSIIRDRIFRLADYP
jgi:hypothetical protein